METITLLEELRKRVPWYSIKPILSQHGIPKGQGWDATILKVLHHITEKPESKNAIEEQLTESFLEHSFCGEKLVQYF